jgi:predicted DNA-binding ribbon-helix-helix protein
MASPKRPMKSLVVKRSVYVADHKTSVSVEDEFWEGLVETANERRVSPSELITSINANRSHANLSSAVRLFVLKRYQSQIAARKSRA